MRLSFNYLILFLLLTANCRMRAAAINFSNFAAANNLKLSGSAAIEHDVLRLTPAQTDLTGAAWDIVKQPVLSKFETTFQFRLSRPCRMGAADGLAFVIQNAGPAALGGRGSAGGFGMSSEPNGRQSGIPWSFAVFFDTWKNGEEGDSSSNSVSLRTAGRPADVHWPADRLAYQPKLPSKLKDQKPHQARIVYRRPVIQVYLDRSALPVLQTTLDLTPVADAEGKAWVGFTASTGFGCENHDVLSWEFQSEDVSSTLSQVSSEISFSLNGCQAGHNLCTPEQSVVTGAGNTYHIILPANVKWGASLPNPRNAVVVISNARGVVCWDVQSLGPKGCSGPSGASNVPAGSGFLDHEAPAGALIHRTSNGVSSFSVNSRVGVDSQSTEGFYEFDAALVSK